MWTFNTGMDARGKGIHRGLEYDGARPDGMDAQETLIFQETGRGIRHDAGETAAGGTRPAIEVDTIERMIENQYPADPRSVPRARHDAMRLMQSLGASDDDCLSLDLALGEALANAVRHGRSAGADEITMSLWIYRNTVIAMVHDKGMGFEPPEPPYAMPAPTADYLGGRGLPLMEQLTDALVICRGDAVEGGSSVYLVKRIDIMSDCLRDAV